ncbi:MAG: DegV family EDD domain-containing protein [Anaerolineae bacterium]|nr:DegV family EDD domain-containing protein [Anaerolineae bacterium]
MQRTAIITDSGVSLGDITERAALPVTILPNQITTASSTFLEEQEPGNEAALSLLAQSPSPPVLEPPTPEMYARTFTALSRDADQIVCICPSRHLTAHWERARRGAQLAAGTSPIKLIDSQLISAGQALATNAIAEAIASQPQINDIERLARTIAARTYFMIAVEQVEMLRQIEMLSAEHVLFSAMLNMKPILSMESGLLHAVAKARSRTHAIDRLLEFATEFPNADSIVILHDHKSHDIGERLYARLSGFAPAENVAAMVYNPSLAALIGLGAIGIAIVTTPSAKVEGVSGDV